MIFWFIQKEDSHNKHLKIIELNRAQLKINLEKCIFFQKEFICLGYKIEVQMDEFRIESIMEYKRP